MSSSAADAEQVDVAATTSSSPDRAEREGLLTRIFRPASSRGRLASAIRRSFAFAHTASRQQRSDDIETGQQQRTSEQADQLDNECPASPSGRQHRDSIGSCTAEQHTIPFLHSFSGSSAAATSPLADTGSHFDAASVVSKLQNGQGLKRSPSGSQPVCLICLENLTPEDFEAGEAIQLECECRGDLALRHKSCAEKWARVKGDNVCDICKQPIKNLAAITPRAASEGASDIDMTGFDDVDPSTNHPHGLHGPFIVDQMPSNSDIIFDCIRVTWVAMIICILFFEMNLASALWTGIITGLAYTLFVRAMYQSQLDVLHREQALRNGNAQPANVAVTTNTSGVTGSGPVQLQSQQQHPYVIVV